ncbi:MAG: restriction endonuclease subunit S [Flavobacteriaceae bacterium]
MLEKIDLKNLDKSNWQTFKFEEIAQKISKTVKPEEANVDVYVGLEHLDAEDIHIRRKAVPSDVKGGKLRCYPGDIIFGKRRAYQRKAAIVDFEGICSAHAFVFRANPKVIDPKLFPFFLHSDQFMHRMVDISVGGLSPTINWGDLKNQEFLLPPKGQQAQLAELLWAMDEVVQRGRAVHDWLGILRKCLHKREFANYRKSILKIGDYTIKVGSGVTPRGGSKVYIDEGVRLIRSQNVLHGEFDFSDIAYISDEIDEKMKSSRVNRRDVLLNITGASIGRCAVYEDIQYANVNQHVCIIRTEKDLDPYLLCEFLNSSYGHEQIQLLQAGGNREGLNYISIRQMRFPNCIIKEPQKIKEDFRRIVDGIFNSRLKITSSKALQKSLINQVF